MKPGSVIVPLLFAAAAITLLAFHHPAPPVKTTMAKRSPITVDTAIAMINAYAAMRLPIVSAVGDSIKGFQMDPQDFAILKANAANYKTLMLYLGVQNYDPAMKGQQKPVYTIVVGSIRNDGTLDPAGYFEYAFPCPPVCPPPPPPGGGK